MVKEGKIFSEHFGVHLKHLESFLNAVSGISPPRDLNSGGWGRAQESAFPPHFLNNYLIASLKTNLRNTALECLNKQRPSKSNWRKSFREEEQF